MDYKKKFDILSIVCILLAVVIAAFIMGMFETRRDYAEYRSQIEELEEERDELRSEVSSLEEEIEGLQYQIDNPDEFE